MGQSVSAFSMCEWFRRAVKNDLLWTMRRIEFYGDGGQNPLRPSAADDLFDLWFARGEPSVPVLGVENKSVEIAKAGDCETDNLASDLPPEFFVLARMVRWTIAAQGRRDGTRVAAQAVHPPGDLADVDRKSTRLNSSHL